jgi:hypothetical protein
LLVAAGVVLALACENDVAVHLLPAGDGAGIEPDAGSPPDTGGPDAGDFDAGALDSGTTDAGDSGAPDCVAGDPCSGLAWALRFQRAYDRVEVPSSPLLDLPRDFTIEAWLYVESYESGHGVFNRWMAGVGDIQLTFGVPQPLPPSQLPGSEPVPSHTLSSWGYVGGSTWITAVAPEQPSTQRWHHIAVSYGGGTYRLYVDGAPMASTAGTASVINPPNSVYIGATARNEFGYDGTRGPLWWPPIDGFIADVRLSAGARYDIAFDPLGDLVADDSTIALWHLSEGQGTQAFDSGPNLQHGAIVGAKWGLAPRRVAEAL